MASIYLWFNAALYAFFAIWCTVAWQRTAGSLGFLTLSRSGQSEYLVIYGGLQLGLALFFAYTAMKPLLHEAGVVFALLLYGCIVVYRVITVAAYYPVSTTTLAVGILEIVMLAFAAWLHFGAKR